MTNINQKVTFSRGLELKNPLVMAPMTTKMSFYDGVVTKDELDSVEWLPADITLIDKIRIYLCENV